jgi:hypothetical protein
MFCQVKTVSTMRLLARRLSHGPTRRAVIAALFLMPFNRSSQARRHGALAQLLDRYHCEVVDRLQRIYAIGDPETFPDQYLIIDLAGKPGHYVQ